MTSAWHPHDTSPHGPSARSLRFDTPGCQPGHAAFPSLSFRLLRRKHCCISPKSHRPVTALLGFEGEPSNFRMTWSCLQGFFGVQIPHSVFDCGTSSYTRYSI